MITATKTSLDPTCSAFRIQGTIPWVCGLLVLLLAIPTLADTCTTEDVEQIATLTADEINRTDFELPPEYFNSFWNSDCSLEGLTKDDLENLAKDYDSKYGSLTGTDEKNPRRIYARTQFLEFLKWKKAGGDGDD